jgi:hypothetical protein
VSILFSCQEAFAAGLNDSSSRTLQHQQPQLAPGRWIQTMKMNETMRLESLYLPIGSCRAPQMHNLDTSDATDSVATRVCSVSHQRAHVSRASHHLSLSLLSPVIPPTLTETYFVILAGWTGREHLIHNCPTAVGYMRVDRVVLWIIAISYSLPFDVLQTALYNKQWTNTTEISLRRRLRLETPLPSSSGDIRCQPQFAPWRTSPLR